MLILNDLHVGVQRVAGTTPASQVALRNDLLDHLEIFLLANRKEHVVVNGDFFDSFQVDTAEVIRAYEVLSQHLATGSLTMIMGNHDAVARAEKVSSFHLLCHFLKEAAAANGSYFRMIDHMNGFCHAGGSVYAISHCLNQDLFNLEIKKAIAHQDDGAYLLLHCNYKNTFAENSDHSLNLNDEQVGNLMRAGYTIVLGHEHIGYIMRGERVIVLGNQFPSSISDCIGDEAKHCLRIENGKHEFIETWRAEGDYLEVDWQALRDGTAEIGEQRFVRIVGDATAEQAADVVNVVARFRQNAENVLVAGNAVKVAGQVVFDEMALESTESIKAFDVLGAIYSQLEPREVEAVKELLG